jgi:hypothetical protein
MTAPHPANTVNPSTADVTGFIFVPFVSDNEKAIAVALLEAAGDRAGEVMAQSGGFLVPPDLATVAGLLPTEETPAAEVPTDAPAPSAATTKKAKAAAADPAPAEAPAADAEATPSA